MDCMVATYSGDVSDSVVSFICTISMSGCEDLVVEDGTLSVSSSE